MHYHRSKFQLEGLYRYAEQKWNDALRTQGSIRIGTLHDYRKAEHKPGVQDALEGMKWRSQSMKGWDSGAEIPGQPSIQARANELFGIIRFEGEGRLQIDGDITFSREYNEPNCFIHCTSYKLSKNVMSQFEGADSCLKITRYQDFYTTLTRAIYKQRPVDIGGLNLVVYEDRDQAFNGVDEGLDACWVKSKDFSAQLEVRAIWYPKDPNPIEPLILEVPELVGLTKELKVP